MHKTISILCIIFLTISCNQVDTDNYDYIPLEDKEVKDPIITPEEGYYSKGELTITITCPTEGATLYYTTNGTLPSESSTKYNGPFSITLDTEPVTVYARGFKDGYEKSWYTSSDYKPILTEEEKIAGARGYIQLTGLDSTRPNSAGGVDLRITFINNFEKTIKYITFTVVPYNSVGDAVSCEIRGRSKVSAKSTGPYEKGEGITHWQYGYWENAWYNWSIDTVKLTKINIEYMDGTEINLEDADLDYIQY